MANRVALSSDRVGERVTLGAEKVREPIHQRLLKPGDSAILLLSRVPDRPNTYYISHGPSGVLLIDQKKMVEITPQMQQMIEFLNRKHIPLDELLGLFRGVGE